MRLRLFNLLIMINKSTLRKEALSKRKALSEQEFATMNSELLNQFKTLDFTNVKSIHIFLPIVAKREPDTFLLIDWLQQEHPEITIVVPKADFDTNVMSQHIYSGKEHLRPNDYQILEPINDEPFLGVPDMVIIPLLAFDRKGYRVGYGKGFYDRFLENITTQKIGLSFFEPTEEIIDVHLNDIKLDKCITPNGIVNFSKI